MVKFSGELIAKAENQQNSALIIETKKAVKADHLAGGDAVPAERASITLPLSVDISSLKRGKKISVTIE